MEMAMMVCVYCAWEGGVNGNEGCGVYWVARVVVVCVYCVCGRGVVNGSEGGEGLCVLGGECSSAL